MWQDPNSTTTTTTTTNDGSVDASAPINVKYNGKLGDVNLVDFADLGSRKENFLERVQKGAISNYLDGGVLPSLTMAQAIGESGWGESKLATQGNALFGIKAGPNWTGATWTGSTIEYYDGANATQIQDNFRAYNSWDESIADHGNLMKASRYAAVPKATSIEEAARAVKAAGYATDPNYVSFIISLANSNNLRAVDQSAKAVRDGGQGGEAPVAPTTNKPSLLKRAGAWLGKKALEKGEQALRSTFNNIMSEIKAKQQEQAQFRKSGGRGGFLSTIGSMASSFADSAIDTRTSSV